MAEYRPALLGNALGELIASADFMAKIKDSECHYLLKNPPATSKQILIDAHLILRKSDYQQIAKYLESVDYKNRINSTFEKAVNQTKQLGLNRNDSCDFLYTNFNIHYKFAKDKWDFVKRFHVR